MTKWRRTSGRCQIKSAFKRFMRGLIFWQKHKRTNCLLWTLNGLLTLGVWRSWGTVSHRCCRSRPWPDRPHQRIGSADRPKTGTSRSSCVHQSPSRNKRQKSEHKWTLRYHPEDMTDVWRVPHPEQRHALQAPDFDQAPVAAAVNPCGADPHTLDWSRMLEVTFLYTFPRLKIPHWQNNSKYKAHMDTTFWCLVRKLSKDTTA